MPKFLIVALFSLTVSVFAQNGQEKLQNQDIEEHFETSELVANKMALLTGTAVNPLLVTGAIGAYKYYTVPELERSLLPWYYKPWFWSICLALVVLSFLASIPSITINLPSFISGFIELCNKKIGLLLTTPIIFDSVTTIARELAGEAHAALIADPAYAYASFLPWEWASAMPEILWFVAIVPMLLFVFFAIWLFNYTFDVLVFLSPFGWLDLCIKIFRGIFYIVLLVIAVFVPQLVFVLVIPLAVVSVLMFGWSVRRVVMGFVFFKDFLNKEKEARIHKNGVGAFAGPYLGVPTKCFGRLTTKDGNLLFSWRRFFLFKKIKTVENPRLVLKKGFFNSDLCNGSIFLCTLPPSYKKIDYQLQSYLDIELIEDSKLKKGVKGVIEWVKSKFLGMQ